MSDLKKILLVEDDELDADLALRNLRKIPLANEIIHLKNGVEVIEYLENQDWKELQVIFLDLKMPKIDGKQVLKTIKTHEHWKLLPVVIMTSSQLHPDIEECYRLGANAFVTKPLDQEEFNKTVKFLGFFWAIVNKVP